MKNYFKDCLYVPVLVVTFFAYLIKLNRVIALAALAPLLILVPLSTRLLKPIKLSQQEYVRLLGLTNNNIQEACHGADVIKAYNLHSVMEDRYYNELKKTLDMSHHNDLRLYRVDPLTVLISELPVAVALMLGGWMVMEAKLTIGMLVAVISAVQKVIGPLRDTYQLVVRSHMAMVSVKRVMYIFELPVEDNGKVSDTEGLAESTVTENTFELKNVSFAYKNSQDKIINNVNLVIKKGSKVALVGPSGGGKSTILKLLCRQQEIKEGEGKILFEGTDFRELSPEVVRSKIALVSQDAVLFPMSVADNIRIGNPMATREQIVEAAKAAECHEFIEALPKGYDTVLEEKGGNLSGGQRQRLSIARAVLKDARVLLLDEPTSALDAETQDSIMETLNRISAHKTVVTVAHRLSTVASYHRIIQVEGGNITE